MICHVPSRCFSGLNNRQDASTTNDVHCVIDEDQTNFTALGSQRRATQTRRSNTVKLPGIVLLSNLTTMRTREFKH